MPHEYSARIKQHGNIPWDSTHMVLGGGYDLATNESLPSPFESVDAEDNYSTDTFPQVDVQAQVFCDAQELTDSLWALAAASSSNLSAATVKTLAPYIRTSKCNGKNACLILRCTLSMPPEHFENELDLTDNARDLLNSSPERFTSCYGEYCVTGQIRQSSFFAVCTYSSTSMEELETFTSILNATRSADKPGVDGATDLAKGSETHESSIRESHRFHIAGIEGEIGLSWLENATVTEAWQGFRIDYKPVPQVALLKHYSSLLPGQIERPTRQYETSWNITEALWKCALLQMAARSGTAQGSPFIATLDEFNERLVKLNASRSDTNDHEVSEMLTELDRMKSQLQNANGPTIKAELETLAEKDKERCPEDEWSHGAQVWDSCGEDTWQFGISPSRVADLGIRTSDIETSVKTCKLPDTGSIVCQKPDPMRHELPGRVIIGARLKNKYPDPREGGKWKRVGGWLGGDTFSIKVETRHTRGCDWEFTVWSVPRSLYEGDGSR